MCAAPRARYVQVCLSGCWMQSHIALQRAYLEAVARSTVAYQVRQKLIAPGFVMAVELTVSSDENQLRFPGNAFVMHEMAREVGCRKDVRIVGGIPVEGDAA